MNQSKTYSGDKITEQKKTHSTISKEDTKM